MSIRVPRALPTISLSFVVVESRRGHLEEPVGRREREKEREGVTRERERKSERAREAQKRKVHNCPMG